MWFETVKNGLNELGIEYFEDGRLVRGLDYYNHTIFEFICDEKRSQGTVLAGISTFFSHSHFKFRFFFYFFDSIKNKGGRYNGLLSRMIADKDKSSKFPQFIEKVDKLGGIGFAMGVER